MSKRQTDLRGTCPACFREMPVLEAPGSRGLVIGRHGWQEAGGRQVGQYDRVTQLGQCFGAGWAPFEISPAGTRAFVEQVAFPTSVSLRAALHRLRECPPVVYEGSYTEYVRTPGGLGHGRVVCEFAVRLQPSEPAFVIGEYPNERKIPSYDAEWSRRMDALIDRLANVMGEGAVLCGRIASWKAAKLVTKAGPTMHMRRDVRPLCATGRMHNVHRMPMTNEREAVTCKRCLAKMEG